MEKKIIISILLISFLFLAACTKQEQVEKKGSFLGGTQGLVASFEAFGVEEDGVYSIFSTETFPLEVTLVNKGEYELQPGDVTLELLGLSPTELSGIPTWQLNNEDKIEKISTLAPSGGEQTLTFTDNAQYLTEVKGVVERHWFANIDYNYQTELVIPEVCLKEDLTDTRICTVKEAKTFFVSGAPITITKVEEDTSGSGIMALKIKVGNVGGGKATLRGDKFGITEKIAYEISDPEWECSSSGKVNEARFRNNDAEIVCKSQRLAENFLATKQLKLTFKYKYRDLIQETLRIKESVE